MIEVTAEQVERVNKLLYQVPGGIQKVLFNSIKRGATTVKTKAAQEAARTYHISAAKFKRSGKFNRSMGSELTAVVSFAGNLIPLIDFSVSYGKNGGVMATVKKDGGGAIKSAFVANMGYGSRVFERQGKSRFPVEQKYGPSAAHMIDNDEVKYRIEEKAQQTVDKRIEHELTRLLDGY